MNGREWIIKEIEQKNFIDNDKNAKDCGYFFGQTHFHIQEIWLCSEMAKEQKRKTLYHELMHVYIHSYISHIELEFTEKLLCDISANSHDIIHEIVKDYFNVIELVKQEKRDK